MKRVIVINEYITVESETECHVLRVQHDIPTWIFPDFIGPFKTPCPVCLQEMGKAVAHGINVKWCSVMELSNGKVYPIHTECFDTLLSK